jgi:hypothetical protein
VLETPTCIWPGAAEIHQPAICRQIIQDIRQLPDVVALLIWVVARNHHFRYAGRSCRRGRNQPPQQRSFHRFPPTCLGAQPHRCGSTAGRQVERRMGIMAYYLGTILFFVLWIGGWSILGRWGRRKGSYNTETLAWLMGIFALLNMELRYLEYLK